MTKLTTDDVLKLAKLSRLTFTKEEIEQLADEITTVLSYVEQLQDAELDAYEPTSQVTGLSNVTRPDEIYDYGADAGTLLKNAPVTEDGSFKVRRMVQ